MGVPFGGVVRRSPSPASACRSTIGSGALARVGPGAGSASSLRPSASRPSLASVARPMAAVGVREYARAMKRRRAVRLLYAIDAVVAAVLAVWWLAEVRADPLDGRSQQAAAYVVALGATVPFALRRLAPRLVFGILAVCFGIALLIGAAGTGVGIAFAAYTVLVRDRRWVGWSWSSAVGYGLIVLAYLSAARHDGQHASSSTPSRSRW